MNKNLIAVVVALLAAIGGYFIYQNNSAKTQSASTATQEVLPEHLADRVLGDANAKVTIVEYANFTCTHCGEFHRTVFPKLKSEFIDTGKVKLVYREIIGDGPGILATSLARCVPADQYFGMAGVLFENQQTWAYDQTSIEGVREALKKYASLAGLSVEKFDKCLDDKTTQKEILDHVQKNAEADKVEGTPTFLLNGKLVDSWQWDGLKATIEKELQ